jgi:hypothetical protein
VVPWYLSFAEDELFRYRRILQLARDRLGINGDRLGIVGMSRSFFGLFEKMIIKGVYRNLESYCIPAIVFWDVKCSNLTRRNVVVSIQGTRKKFTCSILPYLALRGTL